MAGRGSTDRVGSAAAASCTSENEMPHMSRVVVASRPRPFVAGLCLFGRTGTIRINQDGVACKRRLALKTTSAKSKQ
jgi:hypothetical protein